MELKKMQALIIEDETTARERLLNLLSLYPEVEVAGQAETLPEAVALVKRTNPDVVFLDIHLHMDSGFELFNHVQDEKLSNNG